MNTICNLFKVKLNQGFYLEDTLGIFHTNDRVYKFTSNGLYVRQNDSNVWCHSAETDLILTGRLIIRKD